MSKLLLTIPVALLLSLATAYADCTQPDLEGQFRVYAYSAGRVTFCNVTVAPGGFLDNGTLCGQIIDGGRRISGSVVSGRLQVEKSCRLTGNITLRSSAGTVTAFVKDAILSIDLNSISGGGIDSADLAFMFSGQRR